MKKYLFIIVSISFALVVGYFAWTARLAKKKSDDLLAKFKDIDSSLSKPADDPGQKTGIGAVEIIYPMASLKSELILLIDSIKTTYENIEEVNKLHKQALQLSTDTKRLLKGIQLINKQKWDMVDSVIPDTIAYWPDAGKFNEQKWYATNFENQPKFVRLTYLNYLRNQVLKIQ